MSLPLYWDCEPMGQTKEKRGKKKGRCGKERCGKVWERKE